MQLRRAGLILTTLSLCACGTDLVRPSTPADPLLGLPGAVPPCTTATIEGPSAPWEGQVYTYRLVPENGCSTPTGVSWSISGAASDQIVHSAGDSARVATGHYFTLSASGIIVDENVSASRTILVRHFHISAEALTSSIRLTWGSYPGVTSYKVYYKLNSGPRTLLATTTDTTAVDGDYRMAKFGSDLLLYDVEGWNGSTLVKTGVGQEVRAYPNE